MGVMVRNATLSVSISLTALKMAGFWAPEHLQGRERLLYHCYAVFSFMFLLGTYLIAQMVDLYLIWGNIPLMTGTAFILFTNLVHVTKIVNILGRKRRIFTIITNADRVLSGVQTIEEREIVRSCNKEMIVMQGVYFFVTLVITIGWVACTVPGTLPLRAWYPYDTTKSPAYELTFAHQIGALFIAAYLNIAKDTLVAGLIAQCRCQLQLIGNTLKNLGDGVEMTNQLVLTPEQEVSVSGRLRWCVVHHQEALHAVVELEAGFSEPTFAQLTVSLVIICATAFQLSMVTLDNIPLLLSMGTYLLNMMFQVFIYCYQGTYLSEDSEDIADAAYWCPWYTWPVRMRRSLLIVMVRTRRVAKLTAGGFTPLSLVSFMAIIKASYSLFTLLQQVNEK